MGILRGRPSVAAGLTEREGLKDVLPKFTWDVDPILVHIGSFPLRWYSLLFVGVFLGGYALVDWQIRRGGGDKEEGADFIIYGVLATLIGARLGHVLFYDLDHALADPLWVLEIWTGGLSSHGAVIALAVAMYIFTKRRRVSFLEGADRSVFGGTLAATLVRIGNFFNSEIVGRQTDQTWGVKFPRYPEDPTHYRYPTQLFEAGIGIFIFIALLVFDKALGKEKRPRGAMISFWFTLYFSLRFLVEFYKEHQVFKGGATFDMGQYLSIPGVLLGLYGLYWSFKHKIPAGWYEEVPTEELEEEKRRARRKLRDADVDAEFGVRKSSKAKGTKKKAKKGKKKLKAEPAAGTETGAALPLNPTPAMAGDAPPSPVPDATTESSPPPPSDDLADPKSK